MLGVSGLELLLEEDVDVLVFGVWVEMLRGVTTGIVCPLPPKAAGTDDRSLNARWEGPEDDADVGRPRPRP